MRSPRTENPAVKGFTLLELLIAMTIVALMVVIIYGALRVGIRAWEKGERETGDRQRQRIVLTLMERQLLSAGTASLIINGEEPFRLRGESHSLEFTSLLPLMPDNRYGQVYVRYTVTGDDTDGLRLLAQEQNLTLLAMTDGAEPLTGEPEELLGGFTALDFSYLPPAQNENERFWQDSWQPATDGPLPAAVRIILRSTSTAQPVELIIRPRHDINPGSP